MSELVLQSAGFGFRSAGTGYAGSASRDIQHRQRLFQLHYPARERLAQELTSFLDPQVATSWLGASSKGADFPAVQAGLRFLALLPPTYLANIELAPEIDGAIGLDWYLNPEKQLSITLSANGELHYAAIVGPIERASGRLLFDDSIPEEIARLLGRIS